MRYLRVTQGDKHPVHLVASDFDVSPTPNTLCGIGTAETWREAWGRPTSCELCKSVAMAPRRIPDAKP